MGSFCWTDPFTRTKIHEDEDVLMVCLYKHKWNLLVGEEPREFDMQEYATVYNLLRLIYARGYESFGRMASNHGVLIAKGKYDSYGWLKNPDLQEHVAHQSRWEDAQKFFVPLSVLSQLGIDVDQQNLDQLLVDVLKIAMFSRTQLFLCDNFLGMGDDPGVCPLTEKELHQKLIDVMNWAQLNRFD